jgi:o-succinylbenzoate synthase
MKIDSYQIKGHKLEFKFVAGTSRGQLVEHHVQYLILKSDDICGVGEIAPLPKLSIDYGVDFKEVISTLDIDSIEVSSMDDVFDAVKAFCIEDCPSLGFALETALLDLLSGGIKKIFDTNFYNAQEHIPINGLVWMNTKEHMLEQVKSKIEEGYSCIKMKIGAINFDEELEVLKYIRANYSDKRLVLRVDANGAFNYDQAKKVLRELELLQIHSVEQPIKVNCPCEMRSLSKYNSVGVALDEELIGVTELNDKIQLLEDVQPNYLILKPTLLGGFQTCLEWIELAEEYEIGWWLTSALESNIGLNAICQFASYLEVEHYQGLGTGQLYHNNIDSPLTIEKGAVFYDSNKKWKSIISDL